MADERERAGQIAVAVELHPSLGRFASASGDDGQALRRALLRQLEELLSDLSIQAEISLAVELREDARDSYGVVVGGRRCRHRLPATETETHAELARALAEVIYRNRELCLTAELSESIRRKWSSENGEAGLPTAAAGLAPEEFQRYLRRLIRSGFRTERGKLPPRESGRESAGPAVSAEDLFEEAASRADAAIKVFVSPELAKAAPPTIESELIEGLLAMMLDGLFYELGLLLPQSSIVTDEQLREGEYRLQLNDLRLPTASGLELNQVLVDATVAQLYGLYLTGEAAVNPANGNVCAVVRDEDGKTAVECRESGLTTWGPRGYAVLGISNELRKNAGAFVTTEVVEFILVQLRRAFPALVDTARSRFDAMSLTRILRDLLDEEISIRDMRSILEGLLAISGVTDCDLGRYIVFFPNTANLCPVDDGETTTADLSAFDYSNCVRTFLKRYISHKYTRGQSTLLVYLVASELEKRIKEAAKRPLTKEEHERLIRTIYDEVRKPPPISGSPVILTSMEARRGLRRLLEKELPYLPVLSYQELSPEMNIKPIARISWD